jgi:hypothetical protein
VLHHRCYDRTELREPETLLKSLGFCIGTRVPPYRCGYVGLSRYCYWSAPSEGSRQMGVTTLSSIRYRYGRYIEIIGKVDKL